MKNAYKSEHRVQNDVLAAAISREITAMTRRSLAPDWSMACERYGTDDSLRGVTLADAEKALRIVVGLFD